MLVVPENQSLASKLNFARSIKFDLSGSAAVDHMLLVEGYDVVIVTDTIRESYHEASTSSTCALKLGCLVSGSFDDDAIASKTSEANIAIHDDGPTAWTVSNILPCGDGSAAGVAGGAGRVVPAGTPIVATCAGSSGGVGEVVISFGYYLKSPLGGVNRVR